MRSTSLALDFARALDPSLIARDVGLDQLDDWQSKLIDDPPTRLLCCCGRQVGKSTAAAVCALNSVIYQAPSTVVMVSPSQRQSVELFRTFHAMWQRLPGRPAPQYETLQRLELENGSRVISLPGSERTVRGLASVDLVVIDEASRVDDKLLAATRPMLAVSNGALFALTTPAGKRGWFYEQWLHGVGWSRISIKSTECPRISKEFLDQEREQLGPLIFAQEYLCEFHDEVGAAFLTELIEAAFVADFPPFLPPRGGSGMNAHYYIGVDPGQSIDPTAIAVVQRIANANGKPTFRCGHLERLPLATPYPAIVQYVRRLISHEPFLGHSELVLDLTGVGRPVADLFQAEGLRPVKVSITAGDNETLNEHGNWHVAKLLLVSTVQALLHDGRLQIQKDLPEAPILKLELEDFRATVTDSGRWTFGARSGAHDDLVLALALALWRASRRAPMYVHPSVLARSALLRPGCNSFERPRQSEPYPWRGYQRRS